MPFSIFFYVEILLLKRFFCTSIPPKKIERLYRILCVFWSTYKFIIEMRAIPKWVEKIHEENEEKEQTGYVFDF